MTLPSAASKVSRCPICFSRAWRSSSLGALCGFCGLVVTGELLPGMRNELEAAIQRLPMIAANRDWWVHRLALKRPSNPFLFTSYAAEILANRLGRVLRRPASAIARHARATLKFEMELPRRTVDLRQSLSVGVIARATEIEACVELCRDASRFAGEVVFMLDTEEKTAAAEWRDRLEQACGGAALSVQAHPLNGDFAAQRNRVQAAASRPWVLQLDTDERLNEAAVGALPWLIADQEKKGRLAVGLARQNLVDGRLSDHFPDVQYRLCHRSLRYRNRVHETPDLRWWQAIAFVGGAIEHRLERERVLARSLVYEGIETGAGRPWDEQLLLTPFTP